MLSLLLLSFCDLRCYMYWVLFFFLLLHSLYHIIIGLPYYNILKTLLCVQCSGCKLLHRFVLVLCCIRVAAPRYFGFTIHLYPRYVTLTFWFLLFTSWVLICLFLLDVLLFWNCCCVLFFSMWYCGVSCIVTLAVSVSTVQLCWVKTKKLKN